MMKVIDTPKLDFDDVLIVPRETTLESRKDVLLPCVYNLAYAPGVIHGVPLIAANMDTVGTIDAAKVLKKNDCFAALHKHYSPREIAGYFNSSFGVSFHTFLTFGIVDISEIKTMIDPINDKDTHRFMFNLDVANGYQRKFIDFVASVRKEFPMAVIMAGNVVTPEGARELFNAGADIIKIGIGPGQQCETRKVTGVGYPQLSAIMECREALKDTKALICADGGCKASGDVAKAIAAGAHFVMVGSMLAGHKENVSEDEMQYLKDHLTVMLNTTSNVVIPHYVFDEPHDIEVYTYGMSSTTAMDKYSNGVAEYKSSEGKTTKIKYRGTIQTTINQILGGLRSTCTYCDCQTLNDLFDRSTFVICK